MPYQQKVLRLVVASPDDVLEERNFVTSVCDELNHGVAKSLGLRLDVIRWETDTYPGFHSAGPQGLIDTMLKIGEADVLVGVFWKRFGKTTNFGQTGTEHEIQTAIDSWKAKGSPHVMIYFSQQPYSPKSKAETDQWGSVLQFREKLEADGKGLWGDYETPQKFRDALRQHLTQFLHEHGPQAAAPPPATINGHEWHPTQDLKNRKDLTPCSFMVNPNYQDDGEQRWRDWGDILVMLDNPPNGDEVYLLPSRKGPDRFRNPMKLKGRSGSAPTLPAKKEAGQKFVNAFSGKKLQGLRFARTLKDGTDRIHVYCWEYDDFLNKLASQGVQSP